MRLGNMDWWHRRGADGGTALAPSGGLEGNADPVCGQLSLDGLDRTASMQPL